MKPISEIRSNPIPTAWQQSTKQKWKVQQPREGNPEKGIKKLHLVKRGTE